MTPHIRVKANMTCLDNLLQHLQTHCKDGVYYDVGTLRDVMYIIKKAIDSQTEVRTTRHNEVRITRQSVKRLEKNLRSTRNIRVVNILRSMDNLAKHTKKLKTPVEKPSVITHVPKYETLEASQMDLSLCENLKMSTSAMVADEHNSYKIDNDFQELDSIDLKAYESPLSQTPVPARYVHGEYCEVQLKIGDTLPLLSIDDDTFKSPSINDMKMQSHINIKHRKPLTSLDLQRVKREIDNLGILQIEPSDLERYNNDVGSGNYGYCYNVKYKNVLYVCKKLRNLQDWYDETMNLYHVRDVPHVQQLVGVCGDTFECITVYAGITLETFFSVPENKCKAKVFDVITNVIDIVADMHNIAGLAHNDIKPNNICIIVDSMRNLYQLTLIDFGLSCSLGCDVFQQDCNFDTSTFYWLHPHLLSGMTPCSSHTDAYSIVQLAKSLYNKVCCK
nr:serine/threonine kinase [Menippe mercenaria nudivirus]